MTRALDGIAADGFGDAASPEGITTLSPYQTEHINRFGDYVLGYVDAARAAAARAAAARAAAARAAAARAAAVHAAAAPTDEASDN